MDQFMQTDKVVSNALSGKNVYVINDADLEAISISKFFNIKNAVISRYGTSIAASVIDENGRIVPGPGELSKIRIDLSNQTLPHEATGVRGATGRHIAWLGIASTAQSHGLYKKYGWDERIDSNGFTNGEKPVDVPRILASWLTEGTAEQKNDARSVFEESGFWLAVFVHELAQNYSFENVVVGGSLFSSEAGKIMLQTANLTLAENKWSRQEDASEADGASSPANAESVNTGGIDFRTLPMTIQPMGSFSGLNFKLTPLSKADLDRLDIDSEMRQIQNMVQAGITPSGERIKELVAACMQKKEMSLQADNLLLCLVDIFKLEEENASESSPELREALVIVDSQS